MSASEKYNSFTMVTAASLAQDCQENSYAAPTSKSQVFVVGMNGSGTTMLADSLGRHPDLYMFCHETYVLPYFLSRIKSFGDLSDLKNRRRMAGLIGKSKAYWYANEGKPIEPDEHLLQQPGVEGVLNSVYGYFAARCGKQRWGEKTPMHVQHMELLAAHLPDAQFIHIYRDGRDSAQSFHRRWKQHPYRTIYRWKKLVALGREQGKRLGKQRYMEVSYEDLTANPQDQMKIICNFLGLPFTPDVLLSSMRFMDDTLKPASGAIVENSGKWQAYFDADQVTKLEGIAGKFLAELGYPVECATGDKDPSAWQLRTWLLHDKLQLVVNQFKLYGPSHIVHFIRRAEVAIKQAATNKY